MYFAKQKHESIFYHNYKKYDNLKFKEAVDRELMKHDVNNIYYKSSHEIVLSILNVHAPFKKNQLRENHVTFITKVLREQGQEMLTLKNQLKQLKELIIIHKTFALVF